MLNTVDEALSLVMVFAPTLGYIDQIRLIAKTKTSSGFNPVTCAILCFSNILRLFFWLGKRFDNTLLFQSIMMLAMMLVLLYMVVRYKSYSNTLYEPFIRPESIDSYTSSESIESTESPTSKYRSSFQTFLFSFWNWESYIDYINCLLLFTSFIGILYLFLHQYTTFIEILGFVSLGCEATLPLPQIITNLQQRSTEGFSMLILTSWFIGDGFKAFYFIYQHSPIQFILCAFVQLSFDILLVLQFILFLPRIKKLLGIRNVISLENDNPSL